MKRTKYFLLIAAATLGFIYSCKKETDPTAPSVTTSALTNITTTSATAGGTITGNGGAAITASGIVLSKHHTTPTLSDTVLTATATTGSFTVNISNLDFATTYYIRAYATNSAGTDYGATVTLNTTNDDTKVRFTYNGQTVTYGIIISPTTGRKWLDRNLGASRVATSVTDEQAYGDLFEWGRLDDIHQNRTSTVISTQSSTDIPGHGKFIADPINFSFTDWRNPRNDNLWQGSTGINNPCPAGWHVPTKAEWAAENALSNLSTAFGQLKLTANGYRWFDGSINQLGTGANYWSSSVALKLSNGAPTEFAMYFYLPADINGGTIAATDRGQGMAVRCIKD